MEIDILGIFNIRKLLRLNQCFSVPQVLSGMGSALKGQTQIPVEYFFSSFLREDNADNGGKLFPADLPLLQVIALETAITFQENKSRAVCSALPDWNLDQRTSWTKSW